MTFKESDTLCPGEDVTVVDVDGYRLGIGICYDIRFPELAMLYAQQGVQLIVYPGASGGLLFSLESPPHPLSLSLSLSTCNTYVIFLCS